MLPYSQLHQLKVLSLLGFFWISFTFSNNTVCQLHVTMGEFGVYDVMLNPSDGDRADCSFSTAKEPVDIYARKSRNCGYEWCISIWAFSCYTSVLSCTHYNLLALLACFLFYVVLAFLWIGFKAVLRRGYLDGCLYALKIKKRQKNTSNPGDQNGNLGGSTVAAKEEEKITPKKSSRLKSLDTFRG